MQIGKNLCGLEIILVQFLLLCTLFNTRPLYPPSPSTPESPGRSRDIEINIASPQATNSPHSSLLPQPPPPPLCRYVEPIMILFQHQIQTLLRAYHLQINSGVQDMKSLRCKVALQWRPLRKPVAPDDDDDDDNNGPPYLNSVKNFVLIGP
jgi:hypothetical protein